MVLTATTVGGYLRDLPADRRVAMARVCSMIRRSARGVRESMRYGLAFYELQGPLFALESTQDHMTLFIAETPVVNRYKDSLPGIIPERSAIEFSDLNRIPLDLLEKIVRDSVASRRERLKSGKAPTQAELLVLWGITEEKAKAPPPIVRIPMGHDSDTPEEIVEVHVEEPKSSGEILRAPTFKDPAMTASSKPVIRHKTETLESKTGEHKKTEAATNQKVSKSSDASSSSKGKLKVTTKENKEATAVKTTKTPAKGVVNSATKAAATKKATKEAVAKKTVTKKADVTKTPAKNSTTPKSAARKAVATKSVAKKVVAEKTAARRAVTTKAVAEKTVATKAPVKKAVTPKTVAKKVVVADEPAEKTVSKGVSKKAVAKPVAKTTTERKTTVKK